MSDRQNVKLEAIAETFHVQNARLSGVRTGPGCGSRRV